MNGVLVILKPPGMTSHDVVNFVRRLTGQKKAGHTGTLDPGAAGVLPVCLGKATKIIQFMNHDKSYRVEITFGMSTSTQDAFGEVLKVKDCTCLTLEDVKKAMRGFAGTIEQVPPMASAVRHKGKRLYELAREGREVERKKRTVTVYSIGVVANYDFGTPAPKVIADIDCSAGTYIRTIAADLGERLGKGAFMSFLLRMRAGTFTIEEALTLEELKRFKENGKINQVVRSMDEALGDLLHITVDGTTATAVKCGNRITVPKVGPGVLSDGQLVKVMGPEGMLAVAKFTGNNMLQPVKVLV